MDVGSPSRPGPPPIEQSPEENSGREHAPGRAGAGAEDSAATQRVMVEMLANKMDRIESMLLNAGLGATGRPVLSVGATPAGSVASLLDHTQSRPMVPRLKNVNTNRRMSGDMGGLGSPLSGRKSLDGLLAESEANGERSGRRFRRMSIPPRDGAVPGPPLGGGGLPGGGSRRGSNASMSGRAENDLKAGSLEGVLRDEGSLMRQGSGRRYSEENSARNLRSLRHHGEKDEEPSVSMRSSTSGWAKHLGDDDEQSSSRWVVSQREIALRSHRDVDGSQAPKKTAAAAAYDLLAGAWRRARGHPTPAAQVGAQRRNSTLNMGEQKYGFEIGSLKQPNLSDMSGDMRQGTSKRRKWIISSASEYRRRWDIVVMLMVMYEIVSVPWQVAFGVDTSSLRVVSWVSNSIFVVDLVSNFATTFYEGEVEIFDLRRIAQNYFTSGWFAIDFVSCVPFELFAGKSSDNIGMLKALKMFRMLRVGKLFKRIDDLVYASAFRLARIIGLLVLVMHWCACVWALGMSDQFAAKVKILSRQCPACPECQIDAEAFECLLCCADSENVFVDAGLGERYSVCVYMAVAFLLGLGAVNPVTTTERYMAVAFTIFGACLQASVFGSVAVLIAGLDAKESEFHTRMTEIAMQMKHMNLPDAVRRRVLSYFEMMWKMNYGSAIEQSFVNDLSPSLQADVKLCLYRGMVEKIPFLQNPKISRLLVEALVLKLSNVIYLPGDLIMRKGEVGDWMGFIGRMGRVAVLDPRSEERKVIKHLEEGEYIGEMALFFDTTRTADVQALTWVKLHTLSRTDLELSMASYPRDADILQDEVRKLFATKRYRGNKMVKRKMSNWRPSFASGRNHRKNMAAAAGRVAAEQDSDRSSSDRGLPMSASSASSVPSRRRSLDDDGGPPARRGSVTSVTSVSSFSSGPGSDGTGDGGGGGGGANAEPGGKGNEPLSPQFFMATDALDREGPLLSPASSVGMSPVSARKRPD